MEIADILVMNKMDMPSANISLAALEAYARLLDEPPTVVPVSAIERRNIDVLLSKSISAMRKSKKQRSSKKYVKSETKLVPLMDDANA